MADRRASAFLFVLLTVAVVAGGWLLYKRSESGPPPQPQVPGPKAAPGPKAPAAGKTPAGPGKARPPSPPEPPVPATREGCLAFLGDQAGPARAPRGGGMVYVFPEVRKAALDALSSLEGVDAGPSVLQALGGDGDPGDWSEERLHAAGLRIRAGQADGIETVKAFLREEEDLAGSGASGDAARAASWMKGEEGANAVRRLLAADPAEYDAEQLAEVLRAAATLGAGATAGDLRRILDAGKETFEPEVLGAAAGALLRLGDASGRKALDALAEDDWMEGEEFARGLGARGNESVVPWLELLLKVEQGWTRAPAARALGTVGGPAATAVLRGLLGDADPEVREEAAVALALLGGKDVLPAVRKAAGSKDTDLASRAWRALALHADAASKDAAARLLGDPMPGPGEQRRGGEALKRVWAAALIARLAK